jgi:hypothetical protein
VAMSSIANPWLRTPLAKPYVLPEDKAIVDRWNRSLSPADPRRFELCVLPEPFLGLYDARVLLLMANPGSTPADRR